MQPPWHPVGLLLNPPKSSQSDVSYGSYAKQKLQKSLAEYKGQIAERKKHALRAMQDEEDAKRRRTEKAI